MDRDFSTSPGLPSDGGHSYHHCATLNITADASKPLDTRW